MSKPVSKLSILFVFAILIPGTILTYFSIQNIASQKELTEKRLLEEQGELATVLVESFQKELVEHATSFFHRADSLSLTGLKTISSSDSFDYCAQSFMINKNGQFIWPNYQEDSRVTRPSKKSQTFVRSFSQAEEAEFAKEDLKKATEFYQNTLRVAKIEAERATTINALARVLSKSGLINQALRQYRILVIQYGSIIDDSGFPFAYYGLHQLTRIPLNNRSKQIYEDIDNILTRILEAQNPLKDHTELLMDGVADWLARQNLKTEQSHPALLEKINGIRRLLSFISVEGKSIKQLVTAEAPSTIPKLGDFSAIIGSRDDRPYLILLNDRSENTSIVGFKVHLDNVKNNLLKVLSDRPTQFDLKTEIIQRNRIPQPAADPLTTIRELSPFTPSWRVWLHPKNPKAITQYVVKQRWIYGIAITLLMAGMVLGIVLGLRDVSREQKLAQLRSDFVSNVTHELKTPLTSIRMFAETMRLGRVKKKGEQQEYLSIIVDESERLTRLINNVLDFSKIEQGEKQYRFESMNLSQVVEKAVNTLGYWLKAQGFHITSDIEPNIQTTGDEDAIDQAILNLLSNAMKYSADKKEIGIRLWQEDQSIYIKVEDRGIGIPESKQPFVFDKYYRAHTGHEKAKGGSGLGLTVVKHIVDAHQGRIEIKSEVNRGSTFTIILPKMQTSMPEEGDMG